MKTLTIEHPTGDLKDLLDASKRGNVLVKRQGRPLALVISVRDKDEEQIELENDPEFWRMIERVRQQPTIPWEQVKAELGIRTRPRARQNGARRGKAGQGKRNTPA